MIINKKIKGFTLIELILALGIIVIIMLAFLKWEKSRSQILLGENGGSQMAEVGRALAQYIATNNQGIIYGKRVCDTSGTNCKMTDPVPNGCIVSSKITGAPPNSSSDATDLLAIANPQDLNTMSITFTGAPGSTCAGQPKIIPTTNILAAFGKSPATGIKNAIGFDYTIQISNNNNKLTAIVISAQGVTSGGAISPTAITVDTNVNYPLISAAVSKMGGQGGYVPLQSLRNPGTTGYVLQGLSGAWALQGAVSATEPTKPFFPAINSYGLVGYRVSSVDTGSFDDAYLRLDGTNYMTGNLNAGNWDIQNATNISYNGWMTGYGVLANTINSGQINNSGDISTSNLIASGKVRTTDVFLSNSANVNNALPRESNRKDKLPAAGVYLSEIIPKYVSKGVKLTNARVCSEGAIDGRNLCLLGSVSNAEFNCPSYMTPRVIVQPLLQYSTGRVYGKIQVIRQDAYTRYIFGLGQAASFGFGAYVAENTGGGFNIYSYHDKNFRGAGSVDVAGRFNVREQALIQMYCDITDLE